MFLFYITTKTGFFLHFLYVHFYFLATYMFGFTSVHCTLCSLYATRSYFLSMSYIGIFFLQQQELIKEHQKTMSFETQSSKRGKYILSGQV
jgi:hypothetical protein